MMRGRTSGWRNWEAKVFRLLHLPRPASRWGRLAVRMSLIAATSFMFSRLPGGVGAAFSFIAWTALLAALVCVLPLLLQWLRWRMLWKLRDRLLLTYMLVGLAPVALFSALAAVAAYVLFGQFANFAATTEINTELAEIASRNQAFVLQLAHMEAGHHGRFTQLQVTRPTPGADAEDKGAIVMKMGALLDGRPLPLTWLPGEMQMRDPQLPQWAKAPDLGLVLDHDRVYFRAVNSAQAGTHTVTSIASLPLDSSFLDRAAQGLGKITLLLDARINTTALLSRPEAAQEAAEGDRENSYVLVPGANDRMGPGAPHGFMSISGGTVGKRANFLDIAIGLPTLVRMVDWQTGKQYDVVAMVTSRPSLLYQRLFRQSLIMGSAWQIIFLLVVAVCGSLLLLALLMAARLGRTVTRSVADLYQATRAMDKGNLDHRIPVTRKDQLAELGGSFNRMAASLKRLLAEQKEKERLQNELAIAQEVQANLFPRGDVALPHLELHGNCRPARTVSGDYYDFLLFGDSGVGLAIGDISGKGISAALLMATLHSAVRAYRFCTEEMDTDANALSSGGGVGAESLADLFRSPGKILSLLNRHLYRSTQPEKYATLFLAHYDAKSCTLRYSNGGHLPPLLLRADGSVQRLDRGGTVVGLMETAHYDEGAVQMAAGDLLIGYSDGVTEPENEFGEFGEGRMLDVVGQVRHLPLPDISGHLMHALDDWIGAAEQPDDITLVLARQL